MGKTTNLNIRIEPELKEQAELILGELGIPVSNAVKIFLKQVVMHRGIPFDLKLPPSKPIALQDLSAKMVDAELEKGYQDYLKGDIRSLDLAIAEIKKDYKE